MEVVCAWNFVTEVSPGPTSKPMLQSEQKYG